MLSRRILLVEDSLELRAMIGRVLRETGFEVAEAVDGTAALQFLAEHEPDLIILDLVLPGINGYQALDALRTHPRLARLPIIVITGTMVGHEQFKGTAVVAVLHKPFGPEAILGAVRLAFAGRDFDRSREGA